MKKSVLVLAASSAVALATTLLAGSGPSFALVCDSATQELCRAYAGLNHGDDNDHVEKHKFHSARGGGGARAGGRGGARGGGRGGSPPKASASRPASIGAPFDFDYGPGPVGEEEREIETGE
jgi:hypothetical protein